MKSLAAILYESSKDLIVDEIEMPSSLESGQVLVRIFTSGICGAQINEIDAVKGPDNFLPHLLGHEGFCEVLEIARDVRTLKEGDLAILHWRPGSGIQATPAKYKWRGKSLNAGWVTTFNEYAVVSEDRVTAIRPSSVSDSTLPLLGCALTTAYGVLKNEARVSKDESVLIFGAGGVGLTMLKILKYLGISRIAFVDINPSKCEYSVTLGSNRSIVFKTKEQCAEELNSYYGESQPQVAIETTGKTPCIELAYEVSHPQARVVLVGVPRKGEKSSLYTLPLHFGKILTGSKGGGSTPNQDIPFLLDELESRVLDFSDFPTKTFGLASINEAISNLRTGELGRMIIRMAPSP